MKLWLIKQSVNTDWDTYDSAVVVANTERAARHTHPSDQFTWGTWDTDEGRIKTWGAKSGGQQYIEGPYSAWASPKDVTATLLGDADDPTPRVVCASFKAG